MVDRIRPLYSSFYLFSVSLSQMAAMEQDFDGIHSASLLFVLLVFLFVGPFCLLFLSLARSLSLPNETRRRSRLSIECIELYQGAV
jgi:hypothetical protein